MSVRDDPTISVAEHCFDLQCLQYTQYIKYFWHTEGWNEERDN